MEMRSPLENSIAISEKEIQEVFYKLKRFVTASAPVKTAKELEVIEKEIVQITDRLAGLSIGLQIQSASDYVKFGQAPLMFHAGRSPPLQHKESGRRFCFSAPL